jgi:YVTN family beta-propeller protein
MILMKKKKYFIAALTFSLAASSIITSCHKDEPAVDLESGGFPNAVGKIILGKCAVSGCHNTQSAYANAGLDLSSWDKMFEGGNGGACVIPFRPDFSTCMYYVNTFPEFGVSLTPRMPYEREALSYDEVKTLRDWIAEGAPDRDGKIKFADDPNRKKIYVTNQGCDEVAVIDEKTKLVMRYIHVGNNSAIESPHQVRVSPDGQYWYVVFINGDAIQKYRTSDDSYVGEANITHGSWNTFTITADSRYAYCADWTSPGRIKYVDLQSMTVLQTYTGSNLIDWPHGTAVNPTSDTLWQGSSQGNFIYRILVSDPINPSAFDKISVDGLTPNGANQTRNPHDLVLSPDGKKVYVTCSVSNEVRVINAADTSIMSVIPTGNYPLEFAFSTSTPYAFVSCEEDTTLFPGYGKRGCITVFNYQTDQFVANIDAGTYQPHGIVVDDEKGLLYIASRNVNPSGPAPHHSSNCGGKNGYITIVDIHTLQKVGGYRIELSVDPYTIAVRR